MFGSCSLWLVTLTSCRPSSRLGGDKRGAGQPSWGSFPGLPARGRRPSPVVDRGRRSHLSEGCRCSSSRRHAFVLDGEPFFAVQIAKFGAVALPTIHQAGEATDTDQTTPGTLANQWSNLVLAEHPGEEIATGTSKLIDDHRLRAVYRSAR